MDDIIKSGIGALFGFLLAELVNVTRLTWNWWNRPKLEIEPVNKHSLILLHSVEATNGETYSEEKFGVYLKNSGRSIAAGVRVQLIRIEIRQVDKEGFSVAYENAYDLGPYEGAFQGPGKNQIVLTPGAKILIDLASWREDRDVIVPTIQSFPDYYEELNQLTIEYRFTVVAFDEYGRYASASLKLSPRSSRKRP